MSRLSATLRLDARLQLRNRIYLIVASAALGLALGLRTLFSPEQLHFFMPLIALSGISISTCFLLGVLLLLERDEGTLDVVLVSPLRPLEYATSKLVTVSALALGEAALIVAVAYGLDVSLPWLVLAVLLRAVVAGAAGLALGVRYRSMNDLLLPAAGCLLLMDVPVIWYLGLWPSPLFYLWPTTPSLVLAKAAFAPVTLPELTYALGYAAAAAGVAVLGALRALDRHVVGGARA